MASRTCDTCGTAFETTASSARRYCFECSPFRVRNRRSAPHNKGVSAGGKRTNKEGYVWVYYPPAERAPGWERRASVHEHKLVMQRKLGRFLLPSENVHHINGDRADNRPENLELWITHPPKGQRPEDLVEWAQEILARYA